MPPKAIMNVWGGPGQPTNWGRVGMQSTVAGMAQGVTQGALQYLLSQRTMSGRGAPVVIEEVSAAVEKEDRMG